MALRRCQCLLEHPKVGCESSQDRVAANNVKHTWAMLLLGFCGLAFMAIAARRSQALMAA
jgi:hypothetical protein